VSGVQPESGSPGVAILLTKPSWPVGRCPRTVCIDTACHTGPHCRLGHAELCAGLSPLQGKNAKFLRWVRLEVLISSPLFIGLFHLFGGTFQSSKYPQVPGASSTPHTQLTHTCPASGSPRRPLACTNLTPISDSTFIYLFFDSTAV
jgi:hypothetical protein